MEGKIVDFDDNTKTWIAQATCEKCGCKFEFKFSVSDACIKYQWGARVIAESYAAKNAPRACNKCSWARPEAVSV